ncbi:hypothetical protein [Propionivibrio sp.]|uniref:hypothetical protein n=1 Tax=Propionivibrio sp. TaxID=2212460 RepID=UPI003BF3362C
MIFRHGASLQPNGNSCVTNGSVTGFQYLKKRMNIGSQGTRWKFLMGVANRVCFGCATLLVQVAAQQLVTIPPLRRWIVGFVTI